MAKVNQTSILKVFKTNKIKFKLIIRKKPQRRPDAYLQKFYINTK